MKTIIKAILIELILAIIFGFINGFLKTKGIDLAYLFGFWAGVIGFYYLEKWLSEEV
jgi:hypothetical protein